MSFSTGGAIGGATTGMAFGPIGAVAGGALGGLSGGSSKKTELVDMRTPEQKAAIAALNQLAQTGTFGDITLGKGYEGSLGNYQLGEGANQNISYLQNLLYSPQMQQAQQTYSDLANTKFNPDDPSSGYAAFSRQLAKAQGKANDATNRDAAITGSRFGTQQMQAKAQTAQDFGDQSAQYLAQLFQNSRQTQLAGAQGLQSLAQQQGTMAQNALNAQDMQRQLQNQEAQAKYSEWQRARQEKMTQIDLLGTEANRNAVMGYQTTGKDGALSGLFNSSLSSLGSQMGSQGAGNMMGWLGNLFPSKSPSSNAVNGLTPSMFGQKNWASTSSWGR